MGGESLYSHDNEPRMTWLSPTNTSRTGIRCLFLSLLTAGLAAAQAVPPEILERLEKAEKAAVNAQTAGDNGWMLVASALVLMMTAPGLALFYGGLVRKKNVLSVFMQCVILMALVSVYQIRRTRRHQTKTTRRSALSANCTNILSLRQLKKMNFNLPQSELVGFVKIIYIVFPA